MDKYHLPRPDNIEVSYKTPKGLLTIVLNNIKGYITCSMSDKDLEEFRWYGLPAPTPEKDWLP